MCHHTHPFNDITPFVCRASPPLYVYYHIHFIKHHVHILWHHTTLFMTSLPLYWNGIHRICVITTPLLMVSDQLYVWHHTTLPMPPYAFYSTSHPLFMTSHHCNYHITSTAFMTSHTLYMTSHTWKYKRHICHLTAISNTISTVSVSSNPGYQFYHTHSLYDITHTLRVTPY